MPIERQFSRFRSDETGGVAIIVALCLTVLFAFVAFGVDIASLYRDRARLQTRSDLVALGTAADLRDAEARLALMLDGNGLTGDAVSEVQYGRFLRNPAIPREARFIPLAPGAPGVNAVAVGLDAEAPIHFASVLTEQSSVTVRGHALATRTGAASFSLGGRLLRISTPLRNGQLSQAFGVDVDLSDHQYQLLAGTELSFGDLRAALDVEIGFDAPNPAAIVEETVPASAVIAALGEVLPPDLAGHLAALSTFPPDLVMEVGDLLSAADPALGLTLTGFMDDLPVSALDVVLATADALAEQVPVAVDTELAVAGLVDLDLDVLIHERPAQSGWIEMGETGTTLHSAAGRVRADLELAPDLLGGLGAGVSATRLALPIYLEVAGATATLTDLSCSGSAPDDMVAMFDTSRTPLAPFAGTSVAALYLGEFDDAAFGSSAPLDPVDLGFADILDLSISIDLPLLPDITIGLLTLQARSVALVGQSQTESIRFTRDDLATGDLTRGFGSGDLLQTAIPALLSPANTEIRVKPGHAGLVGGLVAPVVDTVLALLPDRLLSELAAPVDGALEGVLSAAALELGAGELTLTGHHCEVVQLVQ